MRRRLNECELVGPTVLGEGVEVLSLWLALCWSWKFTLELGEALGASEGTELKLGPSWEYLCRASLCAHGEMLMSVSILCLGSAISGFPTEQKDTVFFI